MAKKDINVGVSVVQPTEKELNSLGSIKIKVPGFLKKNEKTEAKEKSTEEPKKTTTGPKKATARTKKATARTKKVTPKEGAEIEKD